MKRVKKNMGEGGTERVASAQKHNPESTKGSEQNALKFEGVETSSGGSA